MGRTPRHDQIARHMLTNSDSWIQSFLPLKRWRFGHLQLGKVLFSAASIHAPITVHTDTVIDYPSVEACIADGWEVD